MAGDTIISIFQVRKLMQVRKVKEKEFELWKADSRNTVVLDIWRGLVSEPLQIQNPRMLKTHIKWYSGWLYFFGLQNHCRWWLQPWIKRHLLLGRKVMTNIDSIFKSRDITLPTKVRLVKAMVFPTWPCMDVRVGLWRRLSAEELMLLNCGAGEDSCESLGLQGDPASPF